MTTFIPYSDVIREAMLRDFPKRKVRHFPMGHSGIEEVMRAKNYHRMKKKIASRKAER